MKSKKLPKGIIARTGALGISMNPRIWTPLWKWSHVSYPVYQAMTKQTIAPRNEVTILMNA